MPTIGRVLVIAKRSAYDLYVREHKMSRVRALLRAGDPTVARLKGADAQHSKALAELRGALKALRLKARLMLRSQLRTIEGFDLVISVGGDGTVLNASHGVGNTPLLGINSAPAHSVGFLCSARAGELEETLRAAVRNELPTVTLARMRVCVDEREVHRRVLNDVLFAHKNPAMTSRYFLCVEGGELEEHKSSGLWVGTATGSTAALRSAGGRVLPLRSRRLQYVVREPYTPEHEGYAHEKGLIEPGAVFEVLNKMREGALFLDGPRNVVALEIGQRIRFDLSPEPLRLLGVPPRRAA